MAKSTRPTRQPETPRASRTGIGWPRIPGQRVATVLALQYQLDDSPWWPAETVLEAQLRQLESLVGHAARRVPFHGERLGFLRDKKRGELMPEVFAEIPRPPGGKYEDFISPVGG